MRIKSTLAALSLTAVLSGCVTAQSQPQPQPQPAAGNPPGTISGTLTNPNPRPATVSFGFALTIPGGGHPILTQVADNSPASRAGLRAGDQILAVDGRDTRSGPLFADAVPGQRYVLRIQRGNEVIEVPIVADPPRPRQPQ
jgi:predicted metalloprotease with PDZ domain